MGGHKGVNKTYDRIKQHYYWEGLKDDIQKRIQFCLPCQLKKLVRFKPKNPMIITDTPGTCMEKICIDIVGPLPKTANGNEYILTMQDTFSKFAMAAALPNMLTSTVADAFIQKLICLFGSPKVVLSDQGKNFVSALMAAVAKRLRLKKIQTSAYHPQSNSVERSHHVLAEYLKQYVDKDSEWDDWVDLAMFAYNTSKHESTGYTPFELVFGKEAKIASCQPLAEHEKLPRYNDYLTDLVTRLIGIRKLAHDNLIASKAKSKERYNKRLNSQSIEVGNYVFLQSGPEPHKLGNHYTGPHEVLEILPKNNVKIKYKKRTLTVHMNRLKVDKSQLPQ